MKRTLVLGDVHGGLKALQQVLDRADYNSDEDGLIFIGDLVDGWPESAQVVEYVKNLPNHILIRGNHDVWAAGWLNGGYAQYIWTSQGGNATIESYKDHPEWRKKHGEYLSQALPYYVDPDNNLFVHGGFNWHKAIQYQDEYDLMWDRDLFMVAMMWQRSIDKGHEGHEEGRVNGYKEVFIGHTSTSRVDPSLKPIHASNVWCIDQGGGWEGKLTAIDVATHQYWQSDIVKELYPNVKGR
jgi:serine/threonine protein phosphatase 1